MPPSRPNFQRQIVLPSVAALAMVAALCVGSFYYYLHWQDTEDTRDHLQQAVRVWERLRSDTTEQLDWAAHQAAADPVLQAAMRRRDAAALLAQAQPTFRQLSDRFGIGHWYFITPDRRILLRVHSPQDQGDEVRRKTLVDAATLGQPVTGLELGPMSTLTLRHVLPWRVGDELLGYLEFGTEVSWFERRIQALLGLEVLAAVHKEYTSPQSFERGKRAMGLRGEWTEHPTLALLSQTLPSAPSEVFPAWQDFVQAQGPQVLDIREGPSAWWLGFMPLRDYAGREVASLALLKNRDALIAHRQRQIASVVAAVVVLMLLLDTALALRVRRIAATVLGGQQALLESEQRLRQLFAHLPVAYDSLDSAGRWLDANQAMADLLGYDTPAQMRGHYFYEHWDATHHLRFEEAFARFKAQHGIQSELTLRRRDGRWVTALFSGRVELDAQGQFLRTHSIAVDITERQAMEQHIVRLNAELETKVAARTAELDRLNGVLRLQAQHDSLTGLPNRRRADEHLHAEFLRLLRTRVPYAVLMIDIDFFKHVNDSFGHAVGDQVLQRVAQALKDSLRATDFVARFGGEEFLAILPDTGPLDACHVAQKLCTAVQQAHDPVAGAVTVSIGLAMADPGQQNEEVAVREADGRLYEAKKAGRNRYAAPPGCDLLL
ncbi:MAG: sensor domain-containing diguanylate cyclase [Burkholderiaceae bacterium]|nr:sensor domain-containing diguanylate cyclase [Burkholderiaceae bacterium]